MKLGKFSKLKLVLLSSVMIASCQNKQGGGTVVGAGLGALLGSQFGKGSGQMLAVGIGAVAGGMIGNSIGKQMDEHDKLMARNAAKDALENAPSGKAVAWKNPDSQHSGSVVPTRTYQNREGRYCREYTQTVNIGGEVQKAYGTACRQPDGQWVIVK